VRESQQHECRPLLDACTSSLYKTNSFRVLGVPVTATPRQIKRRMDDLKIAAEMDDLEEEYSFAFPLNPLPGIDELRRAVKRLQDTHTRFVDEFFWFWPLNWDEAASDKALLALAEGNQSEAESFWINRGKDFPEKECLAAAHNLAVLHHIRAIDIEHSCYKNETPPPSAEMDRLTTLWKTSFDWWREIADHEEFWGLLTERIRAVGDPSITNGFLHRFRAVFPSALNNINADFSAEYAKKGSPFHAVWHIQFIQQAHLGGSVSDTSIRCVTKPLYVRIDHAIKRAVSNLRNDAYNGASRVEHLLEETSRPLNSLITLLGSTHQEIEETRDEIAKACCACAIAYGNETEDWETGNELLDKSAVIAFTPRLLEQIGQHKEVMQRNHEYQVRNNLKPRNRLKKETPNEGVCPPPVQPQHRKEQPRLVGLKEKSLGRSATKPPPVPANHRTEKIGRNPYSTVCGNRPPPVPPQHRTEFLGGYSRQQSAQEKTNFKPAASQPSNGKVWATRIFILVALIVIIGVCIGVILNVLH
jgi:transcriptional regulator of met regulon